MKISKTQLKQIIKEELTKVLENEGPSAEDYRDRIEGLRITLEQIPKNNPLRPYMVQGIKDTLEGIFEFIEDPEVRDGVKKIVEDELGPEFLPEEKPEDTLNEDGHDDLPSAVRKLKTAMEDAHEILAGLKHHQGELPAWWMSKVTKAADYLNSARDYFLVSGEVMQEKEQYVKSFYKAKEKRAEKLTKKGVEPDLAFAIADDQMEKAGKKKKKKSKKS